MTKVLILGSEGQIGSHLKMYLKKKIIQSMNLILPTLKNKI